MFEYLLIYISDTTRLQDIWHLAVLKAKLSKSKNYSTSESNSEVNHNGGSLVGL